jgi:hypothetical protein
VSTSITLHCNSTYGPSVCAITFHSGERTVEAVHTAGRTRGWLIRTDGETFCPQHAGYRGPAAHADVVPLYPASVPSPATIAVDAAPDDLSRMTAAEAVVRAGHELRDLAEDTDEQLARLPWDFSEHVRSRLLPPAGRLASLLDPATARLLAQHLTRHRTGPVPAEIFLLANNLRRRLR